MCRQEEYEVVHLPNWDRMQDKIKIKYIYMKKSEDSISAVL